MVEAILPGAGGRAIETRSWTRAPRDTKAVDVTADWSGFQQGHHRSDNIVHCQIIYLLSNDHPIRVVTSHHSLRREIRRRITLFLSVNRI
jgi:hypothetical protein